MGMLVKVSSGLKLRPRDSEKIIKRKGLVSRITVEKFTKKGKGLILESTRVFLNQIIKSRFRVCVCSALLVLTVF